MDILLTGATGYIGSAVLDRLVAAGHQVTALVRSEASARAVEAEGATPERGDLFDAAYLTDLFARHDGVVHTAAAGDETDVAMNDAVVDAAIAALSGTDKPFVHTGGVWTYGTGSAITEDDQPDPPAITGWRVEREQRLLDSDVKASVVQPGIVHGHGAGIATALLGGPRDADGALVLIGSGEQHWTTIHVDDLADLYLVVLEHATGGLWIAASGDNPTVREIAEAAGPVVAGSTQETHARLGEAFGDALLLDQQATGAKARSLGWEPHQPTLVEQVREGYAAP